MSWPGAWESMNVDGFVALYDGSWVRTSRVESIIPDNQNRTPQQTFDGKPVWPLKITLISGQVFHHKTTDVQQFVRLVLGKES